MVRFTLVDVLNRRSLRMDLPPATDVGEVRCIAEEYWCSEGFLLRNGHRILDGSDRIAECIADGDTVEMIPDPVLSLRL
ncbi:MAG: hypothetical protein IJ026_04905 [Candidatus Methanomethylophilaceae archaeon]|nr:hypothetical protein [Candidatus Methanomethylophilaceae archaeon]